MDTVDGLRFGRFELQGAQRRLLQDGAPVPLGARAFDVLLALAERRDRVVTKAELLELVWPGLVVEENNLQVQISTLRKLLGPPAIATIPGRGYRFTAALDGGPAAAPRAGVATDAAPAAAATPPAQPAPASAAAAPAGSAATHAAPGNLPAQLPPLYGRDADLAALRPLVGAHRLVTVVGAGGIGKSRLAQAAAHALAPGWPDGAWMVELAGLSDPALLANAVAQVLEVPLAGRVPALDELLADLAPRRALLVLDNCEHLLQPVGELAQSILRRAPGIALLATSQEPLHLPEEQQYRLMPLQVPAQAAAPGARDAGAVALFVARVRAVDPRFVLADDSLPLAVDICRRLDGLPLAIELAAARVGTLGLRPVRDKLDARFRLLTGGSRATLRRHQTLRAALEWSHALLNDAEKAVFRRLGVFAGGFTVELAQPVAADEQIDEWAALDHLSALVDKSLVVADPGPTPRYRLLETARAFALEQLAAAREGETAETLRRHAQALAAFLQRVDDANLDGGLRTDQFAGLLLPELDNLRAAHAWATGEGGDTPLAVALAAHAGALIDYAAECADWLLPLRPHVEAGEVGPALSARYWRALSASNMTGKLPRQEQIEAARRARSLYETLGQPRRVVGCMLQIARHHNFLREDDVAKAVMDEIRARIRPDWPPEFHLNLLRRSAAHARNAGRMEEALAQYRDAVRISEAMGDWRLQVMDGSNLADMLWIMGRVEEAAALVCSLVERTRPKPAAAGDMAVLLANAIGLLAELGRVEEAVAIAAEALPVMVRAETYYLEEWAYLFWRRGQPALAAQMIGAVDAALQRTGVPMQSNEKRLVAQVRAALQAELAADAYAQAHAVGAALADAEFAVVISSALAQPGGRDPVATPRRAGAAR